MTGSYWDHVLNLAVGCDPASAGCDNCFAPPTAWIRKSNPNEAVAAAYEGVARRRNGKTEWTGRVNMLPARLEIPFRRRIPTTYYLTLNGDMFHQGVTDDFLARTFAMMAVTPHHTYLCTTKRHARMRSLLNDPGFLDQVTIYAAGHMTTRGARPWGGIWPLPNLRLAVSVEDQKTADMRIPALLDTPAAVRWISAEPLIGPIDLARSFRFWFPGDDQPWENGHLASSKVLHWVVTGGESGNNARPVYPAWVRGLRDQCGQADIPFWFKQWGAYLPVPVFDAPGMSGGRAFKHPRGGTSAMCVREPGPSGTYRNTTTRAMNPGDQVKGGIMLDRDTFAVKMGAKAAGRELDGREWNELPRTPAEVIQGALV